MSSIKITLADEINCQIEGLDRKTLSHVIKQTSVPVQGAYMQASYKSGLWDGRESLVDDEGITFQYMLDDVIDVLIEYGIDVNDIEIIDERLKEVIPEGLNIGEDWLLRESGFVLRDHQDAIINKIIAGKHKGVVDAATSSGKTLICLGVSKALDPYTKSVVVVPSENLAKQTYDDYVKSDLSVLLLTAKVKPKDRQKKIDEHRHVILTTKLFMNCIDYFKEDHWALMLDELHMVCGDVMLDILRFDVPHWQVRVGFTGTVPKDKLKRLKIFSHLGGDVIKRVSPSQLQDAGHASTVHISMIKVVHPEVEQLFREMYDMKDVHGNRAFDWSVEQDYMFTNRYRASAIGDYINSLSRTNTLILCHPQFGSMLAPLVSEYECIHDKTDTDVRLEWLEGFNEKADHFLVASFGTASTGLSYNQIKRVVLIDVGKNFSYILQSIGRGMRLKGEENHVEVIDISSNTHYSNRHQAERIKIYKDEKFSYTIENEKIEVKNELSEY